MADYDYKNGGFVNEAEAKQYRKDLNMKVIDYSTLEVDGIDTKDYPDFSDAYFCAGEYTDGTQIEDEVLEELTLDQDLLSNRIHSTIY